MFTHTINKYLSFRNQHGRGYWENIYEHFTPIAKMPIGVNHDDNWESKVMK